ncbi:MAG: GNAT family N-acetyltransferase [Nitrospira sp.]|nr:MAG: GNAT family N-acetyltransferase [Nitrospira sp.]
MTSLDSISVLRINSESQPNVARLDRLELDRLQSLSPHHLIAESTQAGVVAYLLAFADDADYDGEEFLKFRNSVTAPFLYIDQVAVTSQAKGNGIGAALYRDVEQLADERGIGSLCCEINIFPPNSDSIAFHRKMGFRAVRRLDTLDGRAVELYAKGIKPCSNNPV